jgi:uncharacterized membrane protein YtjA (UPF0391 family)
MLRLALLFLVLALISGFFGFSNLEGQLAYFARIMLFIFLVLFVVSLIFGRRAPAV